MPSVVRAVAVLGLVVVVAGTVAAGYGVYEQQADTCESGYGLSAWAVGPNETADPSFERVAYENLSSAEQRVFEEAVENNSTGVVENRSVLDGLGGTVVEYRGDRYETVVWVKDCGRSYASFVILGALTAAVGGVVAGGAFAWRRLRH
jgi:hypothetical protein